MLDLLGAILCAIKALAAGIVDLLMMAVNGIIMLFGTTIAALLALFPDMPDPVSVDLGTGGEWFAYFVPVPAILAVFAACLTIYVASLVWYALKKRLLG